MTNAKKVFNQTRLRNLKRASLKSKEQQLQQYSKDGNTKMVNQTMKEIQQVKKELAEL